MIEKITKKEKPKLKSFRRLIFDSKKINYKNGSRLYEKKKQQSVMSFNTFYKFPYTLFRKNNHYKYNLFNKQKLKFLYGYLSIKHIKKTINVLHLPNKNYQTSNILNSYFFFFKELVVQLQYILYSSCFVINLKQSKQLIKHGHIKINNIPIKTPNYKLQPGDIISISKKYNNLVNFNISQRKNITILPKSLQINYKTLQICFIFPCLTFDLQFPFEFYVNSLDRYFQTKNY